jgi:uncharacterized membrane protein YraQ (UPF0718 family)
MTLRERHIFAKTEMLEIFKRVWIWVIVGLGAALYSFVPDGWIEQHLGSGQWWSVPAAVIMAYGIMTTPVIVMNESVMHKGSIPSHEQVSMWLHD